MDIERTDFRGVSQASILCFLALLSVVAAGFLPGAAWAQIALTILHSSEHHGTLQPIEQGPFKGLGGVARRATLIERARKETGRLLLLDSGDLLIGTAMSSVFRGVPDIAAMNLMGYDALAVGNHDFDFGVEHLKGLRKEAQFPFLCTNARPRDSDICRRFVVKSVGPLRVGLLGLVGKHNYPDLFNRSAGRELEFQEPILASKAAAAELRQRVDLLIAITHEETEEDLALARSGADLDIIVGGHTEGFDGLVPPGETVPVQGRTQLPRRGPIFVKTHRQGRTLGRLDLWYQDGRVRVAEARNLPVEPGVPENAALSKLLQDFTRRLDAVTNRVLGKALVHLEGESPPVRSRETNLGNLLADLARTYAGTQVALVNSGMIRGSIPPGPVTLKRIMEILPFGAPLISFKITGTGLREAMENGVSQLPKASGRFLQVSGLTYLFDPTAAVGSRVKEIRVHGAALDPARHYSIVVDQFLAEGGDGYEMFLQVQDQVNHQTPLRDLLAVAVKAAPLAAREEGRIKSWVPVRDRDLSPPKGVPEGKGP